jgi:hypothetical protein
MATLELSRNDEPTRIILGERLRAELVRRVHELESRFKPTHAELRELAALMEILKAPEGRQ